MSLSTAPQRNFILALAGTMSDQEFTAAIRATGHTGSAADAPGIYTRNQILKRISKSQASEMIETLKAQGLTPAKPKPLPEDSAYLHVTEPEPLAPIVAEPHPGLLND